MKAFIKSVPPEGRRRVGEFFPASGRTIDLTEEELAKCEKDIQLSVMRIPESRDDKPSDAKAPKK